MSILHAAEVTGRGRPASPGVLSAIPLGWRVRFPEYTALLEAANGLEIRGGLLRVFGVGDRCLGRDALAWNAAAWRPSYQLPDTILLWGETIVGDQLGVDTASGASLVVNAETGEQEVLRCTPLQLLEAAVLGDPDALVDRALVDAALRRGLRPSLQEHLALAVPYFCGGRFAAENLQVLRADVHFSIQGQVLEHVRELPPGTVLRGLELG